MIEFWIVVTFKTIGDGLETFIKVDVEFQLGELTKKMDFKTTTKIYYLFYKKWCVASTNNLQASTSRNL